jgi:ABC-type sugar transport system permease subunit
MTSAVKKPTKKRASSLERKKSRAGWIFTLPFLIGFILIYLPIVYESIKSTFFVTNAVTGSTFVWFDNYRDALFSYTTSSGQTFITMLGNALTQLIIDIPAILIFSLFMAVLLNQKMAGRAFFRAIFFIPVIIATGIMESIEAQNVLGEYMEGGMETGEGESATDGLVSIMDVEKLFANLMVGQGLATYVTQLINNIFNIVNRSGVQMLIFLAGLQSISPAIYESCQIDGASAWETFWKITFPMISPMILVNAIYTIIDSFTTESNIAMKFIEAVYSSSKEVSVAMSWMYFLIVILILAAISGIISMYVFYQKRD